MRASESAAIRDAAAMWRGPKTLEAWGKVGCVHLHAIGGVTQILVECVTEVLGVSLEQFGSPEAGLMKLEGGRQPPWSERPPSTCMRVCIAGYWPVQV